MEIVFEKPTEVTEAVSTVEMDVSGPEKEALEIVFEKPTEKEELEIVFEKT